MTSCALAVAPLVEVVLLDSGSRRCPRTEAAPILAMLQFNAVLTGETSALLVVAR